MSLLTGTLLLLFLSIGVIIIILFIGKKKKMAIALAIIFAIIIAALIIILLPTYQNYSFSIIQEIGCGETEIPFTLSVLDKLKGGYRLSVRPLNNIDKNYSVNGYIQEKNVNAKKYSFIGYYDKIKANETGQQGFVTGVSISERIKGDGILVVKITAEEPTTECKYRLFFGRPFP